MYNDSEPLSIAELGLIEQKLKNSMTRRMASIQEDRALNTNSANVGSARSYVEEARALRKILKMNGGQKYVPVREMSNHDWVSDDVTDALGLSFSVNLHETCERMHAARSDALGDPDTLTDHQNVPGTPA